MATKEQNLEYAKELVEKLWQDLAKPIYDNVKGGEVWEDVKEKKVEVSLDWLDDMCGKAGELLSCLDPENWGSPMWAENGYLPPSTWFILEEMAKRKQGAKGEDLPEADKEKLLAKKIPLREKEG